MEAAEEPPDRRLDEIAADATLIHLQTRSLLILEAAISALMDVYSIPQIAHILRDHATHLEDHG